MSTAKQQPCRAHAKIYHELTVTWTVSRGRDTYGYNIVTLRERGDVVARCNGGGYDMRGTVFADWLEKRLSTWDHNELGTLLVACHVLAGRDEDWDMDVYYSVVDGDAVYSAWSDGVDWAKVEADVAELRAEKEAEARAEDPDYIPPPVRCPLTLNLFDGRT